MKHKKKLLAASQIILIAGYPIAAKSEPIYSVDAMVNASIEEPEFIYKVTACDFHDSLLADAISKNTGKKINSTLLKNGGKEKLREALIDSHTISEMEAALKSRNFDKFANFFDPNGFYSRKQQIKICRDAMILMIAKYELKKRTNTKDQHSTSTTGAHQNCLEARDYEGCMRFKGDSSSSKGEEKCNPDGWCIAKKGVDSLGFPKKVGWKYKMMDSGSIWYVNTVYKRIPHNGDSARYLGFEKIRRYYKNPTSGTPGSQTTIGSSRTNCTGYGVTISCTTTPPTVITTPGTSGSPGGKRSTSSVYVLDCKEKTTANYQEGRLKGKWEKADAGAGNLIKYQCPIISTLPVLNMKL